MPTIKAINAIVNIHGIITINSLIPNQMLAIINTNDKNNFILKLKISKTKSPTHPNSKMQINITIIVFISIFFIYYFLYYKITIF